MCFSSSRPPHLFERVTLISMNLVRTIILLEVIEDLQIIVEEHSLINLAIINLAIIVYCTQQKHTNNGAQNIQIVILSNVKLDNTVS